VEVFCTTCRVAGSCVSSSRLPRVKERGPWKMMKMFTSWGCRGGGYLSFCLILNTLFKQGIRDVLSSATRRASLLYRDLLLSLRGCLITVLFRYAFIYYLSLGK